MVKERFNNKKVRGFTLMELVLVLAVATVLLGAAFVIYNSTLKPNQEINEKLNSFAHLVSAIENARAINGGAYPAVTENNLATPNNQLISAVIGNNTASFVGWGYSCSGNKLTITMYYGDITRNDTKEAIRRGVTKRFAEFSNGTENGTHVPFTRSNVFCSN